MLRILNYKNPFNLKKCNSQWIGCYTLFGPIFYLHESTRKQIEQLLLLCSLLGKWCSSLVIRYRRDIGAILNTS